MEADLPHLAALEALDTGKPIAIVKTVDLVQLCVPLG
jgi:aldehyde dehydrogenase (NAD+)/phenylacetaldehyde dehydrogenase